MRILLLNTDWNALILGQQIFWAIAIVATLLLIILLAYELFVEETTEEQHTKPNLLDARIVLLFFTALGWSAVAFSFFHTSNWESLGCGAVVGLLTVIVNGVYRFRRARANVLAQTGKVLQTIPPHRAGVGKVYLNVQRNSVLLNAVTQGKALPVGAPVRVVSQLDDQTLLVEPLEEEMPPPSTLPQ